MTDIMKVLLPALIVPLLLVIMVSVYMQTSDSTANVFEVAIVNESLGTGETTSYYTDEHCKDAGITAVHNGSDTCAAATCYNVTYQPLGTANVTNGPGVSGAMLVSYTSYSGEGYNAFDKIGDQTYSGFELASILPYVIIAMALLGLLIAAFTKII